MTTTTIKDELLALQRQAGDGLLQVEPVVTWAAQHPDSALHKSLPWDDAAAAHEWRCHLVRRLIAIHIVNETGVRQMVSLTIDRTAPGGGYRSLNAVMAAPNLRKILLNDALDELERVQRKYEAVTELARVWQEIEHARQQHAPRKQKGGKSSPPHAAA
jgi:hypothetical protein